MDIVITILVYARLTKGIIYNIIMIKLDVETTKAAMF